MSRQAYFTDATLGFLAELAVHNDREWFAENRARYERDVKEPALAFIADFSPRLATISKRLRADPRPVGGSLFRIHRDVRFSNDKSPYKTHLGIRFPHDAGRDVHAPGLYLHVEPGGSFAGCGMWRPASGALAAVRWAIVEDPAGWKRASRSKRFRAGWELGGESLKTFPRGFDPGHPLIADLRRTDFVAFAPLAVDEVTSPGLPDRLAERFRPARPFVGFLCRAVGEEL